MADDLGFPELDPRPDEEAWEAYLTFAAPILGSDDALGLENDQLIALEEELGTQLPFEIGLLLVMGVPPTDGWWRWHSDAAERLAAWNDLIGASLGVSADDLVAAPKLLPLFEDYAVPVEPATGREATESNPILHLGDDGVTVAGLDLADWLHKQFDIPLPWWPENEPRTFPFWSEITPSP
ncbi:MAG: hypothetical protein HKN94_16780 [Acidimicrobiales bacterium]|nr:hypothetical protein [Acidimicrobiia bacterium]NNC81799.1 hypothetical protein [Acidimicrobiales bacterium]RZV42566.1 MAG: hypothetical protein EX269_14685 [Acidimicrobiales bacterium]